jgi:hypothetical protein
MHQYRLMNLPFGLFMDVLFANANPGTTIDASTQNRTESQLWTFERTQDTPQGFFYIKSTLGNSLVVQVNGNNPEAPLQLANQIPSGSSGAHSQLWTYVPQAPGEIVNPQGFILSFLDNSLAVAAQSGTRGLGLVVKKKSSTTLGIIWALLDGPNNDGYKTATISTPVPTAQGFQITGTGFHPASSVFAHYEFLPQGAPSTNTLGSIVVTADLGGNFVGDSEFVRLAGTSGTLQITLVSVPPYPDILAHWDGHVFS